MVITCEIKYWNNFKIIKKLLFQPLKEFWNYFKIITATSNVLENIHELQ